MPPTWFREVGLAIRDAKHGVAMDGTRGLHRATWTFRSSTRDSSTTRSNASKSVGQASFQPPIRTNHCLAHDVDRTEPGWPREVILCRVDPAHGARMAPMRECDR